MKKDIRKVIFSIVLFGLIFISYQYMIKSINSDFKRRRTEILTKSNKLDKLTHIDGSEKAIFAAKYLSGQVDHLKEIVELLEERLPLESDIHRVLEQVTLIAQKHGLKPKTIRTLNKRESNGYMEQPLKLQLVGDFNSFYSYLLELEKLPQMMKIRELKVRKLKSNDNGKQSGSITADFVIGIFFQEEDSEA